MDKKRVVERFFPRSERHTSRSPTRTAQDVREKTRLRKSLSDSPGTAQNSQKHLENKQTIHADLQEGAFVARSGRTDNSTENITTKGKEISISVKYLDVANKEQEFTVTRSCTIEEFMKWEFILRSPKHLDQCNVYLKDKLDFNVDVRTDCILLHERIENPNICAEISDNIIAFTMNHLGSSLCVKDIGIQSNHIDRVINQIQQNNHNAKVEIIEGHLYFACMNREKKNMIEYIGDLVNGEDKHNICARDFKVKPVWQKIADSINLDQVLKGYADCPELQVTCKSTEDHYVIILEVPKSAVDRAVLEFKNLKKRMIHEKCKLQVTSKFAIPELQVESVLDEHLRQHKIQCVTYQESGAIYVYGFHDECITKAKREVEATIIEKTCIIKGDLKRQKDSLVSFVKSKWPGLVVLHIGERGYLHIVGLKIGVEEIYQLVADLKEGKLELFFIENQSRHQYTERQDRESFADSNEKRDIMHTKELNRQRVHLATTEVQDENKKLQNVKFSERTTAHNVEKRESIAGIGKTDVTKEERITTQYVDNSEGNTDFGKTGTAKEGRTTTQNDEKREGNAGFEKSGTAKEVRTKTQNVDKKEGNTSIGKTSSAKEGRITSQNVDKREGNTGIGKTSSANEGRTITQNVDKREDNAGIGNTASAEEGRTTAQYFDNRISIADIGKTRAAKEDRTNQQLFHNRESNASIGKIGAAKEERTITQNVDMRDSIVDIGKTKATKEIRTTPKLFDKRENNADIGKTEVAKAKMTTSQYVDKRVDITDREKNVKNIDLEEREKNAIREPTDTFEKKQMDIKAAKTKSDKNFSETKQLDCSESVDFVDKKQTQFLLHSEGRSFLKDISEENGVEIHQHIVYKPSLVDVDVFEDVVISPERESERTIVWQTTNKKDMLLTSSERIVRSTSSGSRFVSVRFKDYRPDKEPITLKTNADNTVTVAIRVPTWAKRKGCEEELMDLLDQLITKTEDASADYIIIPLETTNNWPVHALGSCIVHKMVQQIFLNSTSRKSISVLLQLRDDGYFDKVFLYIQKHFHKSFEDLKANQNLLKVRVIPGELDKVEADVIVNTTSKDLDLSNGKVSSTLLKAAGSGIQTECRMKYPRGISGQEVAVTGGHKLKCENVFHIALERFLPKKEMNSIESIRSLVMNCLKTASYLNHKTIAFPAIGTGVLRYPIDLVSATMFESVERFKSEQNHTSLQTVLFVIYPSDTRVMEVFDRDVKALQKAPKSKKDESQDTKVQLKLSGERQSVAKAKFSVSDRCEDELYDPSDVQEMNFPNVTHQDYLALRFCFDDDIKALAADNVKIKHKNETISLCGKYKDLKRASAVIKKDLKIVSSYHFISLSVRPYNPKSVETEVHLVNKKKEVFCRFDNFLEIVHIFGGSQKTVKKVMKLFKEKLDREITPNSDKVVLYESTNCSEQNDQIHHGKMGTNSDVAPNTSRVYQNLNTVEEHDEIYPTRGDSSGEKNQEEVKEHTHKSKILTRVSRSTRTKQVNRKVYQLENFIVYVYKADILEVPVECVVNPANANLDHTGGLAFKIAQAAGDELQFQSAKIVKSKGGPLSTSSVVCTSAGKLSFDYILHAVGPCWYEYCPLTPKKIEKCLNLLKVTVISCFCQAEKLGIGTIALPTISSGLFGVPKELCAIQYANAILEFSRKSRNLKEIHIVDICHDMIEIVQGTFDMMIEHRKILDVNLSDYIDVTVASVKESNGNEKAIKNTARDKPGKPTCDSILQETFKNEDNCTDDGEELTYKFSSQQMVRIYKGDILKLREVDTLVCSVNGKDEAKDEISKQLLEIYGTENEDEKSGYFKKKRNYGDVFITSGGKSNFKCIIYAITPEKQIKALHMMYINLFEVVTKKGISCFACPLLGTGKIEQTVSAKVFLEEFSRFCAEQKHHPLTIHLVVGEQTAIDEIKNIFREHFEQDKSSTARLKLSPKEKEYTTGTVDTERQNTVKKNAKVKEACPICRKVCGVIIGDQPDGRLEIVKLLPRCSGYDRHKSIALFYYFPPGKQGENHPKPGTAYRSLSQTGLLPDTEEGRRICSMLKVAFERRLVFTIRTSRTTGEGVITCNDIHQKTDLRPNSRFGYPDKTYLQRVREELAIKGVTEEDIDRRFMEELKADSYRQKFTACTCI